ncbi:unnamed protein product, partial [Ectocarpus sp. 12 AP-2014]
AAFATGSTGATPITDTPSTGKGKGTVRDPDVSTFST